MEPISECAYTTAWTWMYVLSFLIALQFSFITTHHLHWIPQTPFYPTILFPVIGQILHYNLENLDSASCDFSMQEPNCTLILIDTQ